MFTVQYVPLSKIKPDVPAKMTSHIRKLRSMMWDCMHLLVVRKNQNDGSYAILLGNERYEYLSKHTKKLVAPCLVDDSTPKIQEPNWLYRFRRKRLQVLVPGIKIDSITPAAWSIIRTFLKEEPRFKQLKRRQQIHVLVQAVRYRKIVVASMKMKVDQLSS
ncbi:hypothetical protein [Brevibacillus choshinensis]|uniref:ParB/Sulfiredoxin domain-containing protein n=1 Tax=Brevibacillus choshinensis TaxID=54911 RepID=A0ABX7FKF6_BRECH|nr:hypothetical protein [Brevibacillus choshinensis]QRG66688.1 hypothetical protein JNE38_24780 [Brevibacillus choshinensis]